MAKQIRRTQDEVFENPRSLELNMMVRKAALVVDPRGRITALAAKAGISGESVYRAIRNGRFPAGVACALELAVGREHLTKEALCPEKYAA